MEGFALAGVLAVVALVGLLVVWMVWSARKSRAARSEINRSLGFTPVKPAPDLAQKITRLYKAIYRHPILPDAGSLTLQNVFSKRMPDCEMMLFDLVNTAGDDDSFTEKQAVAVVSHHLNLPPFVVFPKADLEGSLNSLANKILTWVVSRSGQPVDFPEVPEFDQRFLVSSPDPDGTRQFLDESRLRRLAKSRLIGIHAGGDVFTLSRIDMASRPAPQEMIADRVTQALDVFSIFLS
jgi:hypothetical protein